MGRREGIRAGRQHCVSQQCWARRARSGAFNGQRRRRHPPGRPVLSHPDAPPCSWTLGVAGDRAAGAPWAGRREDAVCSAHSWDFWRSCRFQ